MNVFVCLQMALQSTSRHSLVYVFTLRVFVSFGSIAIAMPTTAGQALPATSHDATAPGQALAVPADVAMPSSAGAPVGWQLAWQVLCPDSKGVGYW